MTNKIFRKRRNLIAGLVFLCVALFIVAAYTIFPRFFSNTYSAVVSAMATSSDPVAIAIPKPRVATHVKTPEVVRAIYMTSWVAGTSRLREPLVSLIDTTELNAVVIDIKDYSGRISFLVNDPVLKAVGSEEKRIADIDDFLDYLHSKNIYVIGRISTFQDAYFVKKHPELAVKLRTDKNVVWADHKGISWIDASAPDEWDYITSIGQESYSRGFDELNFDYIRFPSDGNMKDISYPWSGTTSKPIVLRNFFKYLHDTFKPQNIPISADLFGMVTTNTDDLNIGQVLENALPYFDFVSPMVYPSHYPPTWNGFKDPEAYPYDVVHISMKEAVRRAIAMGEDPLKLRPWLQDFSLRLPSYTPADVRAQMKATYDSGLTSWMLWNASNRYTVGALALGEATTTPMTIRPSVPATSSTSTRVGS